MGDGEAETRTAGVAASRRIRPLERHECTIDEVGREAGAVVEHRHRTAVVSPDLDHHLGSGRSVADRVVDEVANHPAQRFRAAHRGDPAGGGDPKLDVPPVRRRLEHLDGFIGQLGEVDPNEIEFDVTGFEPGENEEIVHEGGECGDILSHRAQIALGVGRHPIFEGLHGRLQRRQRGP